MRKPAKITFEQKILEGHFINAAIDRKGYKKKEVAEMIGYDDKAISQWFNEKKPTAIPDFAYAKLAEILEIDPTQTRPWLKDLYLCLDAVFKADNKQVTNVDIIRAALSSLSDSERQECMKPYKETLDK